MLLSPSYRDLILALAAERRRQGLSQWQLEQKLGVAEGHVAKWESGWRTPSPVFLIYWLDGLGLKLGVHLAASLNQGATNMAPSALALTGEALPRKPRRTAGDNSACCDPLG